MGDHERGPRVCRTGLIGVQIMISSEIWTKFRIAVHRIGRPGSRFNKIARGITVIISVVLVFIVFRRFFSSNHLVALFWTILITMLFRRIYYFMRKNRWKWIRNGLPRFIRRGDEWRRLFKDFYRATKMVWDIQKANIMELALGMVLFLALWWALGRNFGKEIPLHEVFGWVLRPQHSIDFSMIFVFAGMLIILAISLGTASVELFWPKTKMLTRWLLVPVNCVPVYIYVHLMREIYNFKIVPEPASYSIFGLAALLAGNITWLFLHEYFVENLQEEMNSLHLETFMCAGLSRLKALLPRAGLMVLEVLRPIFLCLLGAAIFVEYRFQNDQEWWLNFRGMSYGLYVYLRDLWETDRVGLLGIVFSVILMSTGLQAFINHARYKIDPELRYGKQSGL